MESESWCSLVPIVDAIFTSTKHPKLYNIMNTKNKAAEAESVANDDWCADVKPKSLLPNGKYNPAYQRWRRRNVQNAKDAVVRYNSGGGMAKSKAKARQEKLDKNEMVEKHQVKCMECGQVFDSLTATLEGFAHFKSSRWRGVCGFCG
jgi:hypothetical protein